MVFESTDRNLQTYEPYEMTRPLLCNMQNQLDTLTEYLKNIFRE